MDGDADPSSDSAPLIPKESGTAYGTALVIAVAVPA